MFNRISLIVITVCLFACGEPFTPEPERVPDLEQNRELWESNSPSTYRFNFRRSCFCGPDYTREVMIFVENNNLHRVVFVDDGTEAQAQDYPDLDAVFKIIDDAIADDVHEILVDFHPKLGFPRSISIDRIENAIDDEIAYFVDHVELNDTLYTKAFAIADVSQIAQGLDFQVLNASIVEDDLLLDIETSGCGSSFFRAYVSTALSKSLPPQAAMVLQRQPDADDVCDAIKQHKLSIDLGEVKEKIGLPVELIHDQFSVLYSD